MSNYNQTSNPFHQYDTRYKPDLPVRMNANTPWTTTTYNPSYNTNYSTFNNNNNTNSGPLYFHNGNNVSRQEWWGSFKK